MYTCSEDGSVKTHDMRTNSLYNLDWILFFLACPHNFNNKDPINCIVLHPNEAELIVGD
jgi:WD40 repeat protein